MDWSFLKPLIAKFVQFILENFFTNPPVGASGQDKADCDEVKKSLEAALKALQK